MKLQNMTKSALTLLSAALLLTTLPVEAGNKSGLDREQRLGKLLYQDSNLSLNKNQSCASCHALHPVKDPLSRKHLSSAGFVDADNVLSGSPVSDGSIDGASGSLNAPSAGYAAFSPFFHWDGNEGLYVGGQFWNGRAETLAEQARGPFLNPVEMAMPSKWAVISRLKQGKRYVAMFRKLYKLDLDMIPAYEGAPADMMAPPGVEEVYQRMAEAIAAFEKSRFFNRFTSKFDFVIAGQAGFTEQEALGFCTVQW